MEIGWIDYSKEEKNRITTILSMLSEQGTLDELGIGTIRNAFSEALFPAVSTLYTRAKYFVLIPYIFSMVMQQKRVESASDFRRWFERYEDDLIDVLIKNSPSGTKGIFGSSVRKQGKTLRYRPSTIYWNGIKTLGIIRHPDFSIDDACDVLFRKMNRRREVIPKSEGVDEAGDDDDVLLDGLSIFTPIIPDYDVMIAADIYLNKKESEYLKERFITSRDTRDSLIAHMLREDIYAENLEQLNTEKLPKKLRGIVELAKQFTSFVYGAYKLYNVIFSDCQDQTIVEGFESWIENEYQPFNLDEIIAFSECPKTTADFLLNLNQAFSERDVETAESIVINREKYIKRDRAKLRKPNEYRYEKPVHDHRLNYRFPVASTIIKDIREGLKRKL